MWKMIHKRWLSLLVFGADMVTRFAASNKCIWYLYQEEIPKDAVKLKKMKNKREDRFEAIVDQFVKMI
mgnify:FL=1